MVLSHTASSTRGSCRDGTAELFGLRTMPYSIFLFSQQHIQVTLMVELSHILSSRELRILTSRSPSPLQRSEIPDIHTLFLVVTCQCIEATLILNLNNLNK